MKDLDEALKLHFEEFYKPINTTIPILRMSDQEWNELVSAVAESSARPRRRGRPPAWDSSETNHSFAAALFVYGHMRAFRRRNLIKGVPVKARDVFLDIALRLYPKAKKKVVLEHIRENKKYGWDQERPATT